LTGPRWCRSRGSAPRLGCLPTGTLCALGPLYWCRARGLMATQTITREICTDSVAVALLRFERAFRELGAKDRAWLVEELAELVEEAGG
jgi:hypothetical protein